MKIKKRHSYPRSDGTCVPRPWQKWLEAVFVEKSWRNRSPQHDWFHKVRGLATSHGCNIKHDPKWHWSESMYMKNYKDLGPHILAGGRGRASYVSTAILHELGHHILHIQKLKPAEYLAEEAAAWKVACRLAADHQLPFVAHIRRQALYSYRYRKLCEDTAGSRRKNKRPARMTVDRIQNSKQSSKAGGSYQLLPVGKKGKRLFKREQKRRAARHERRNRRLSDD